MLKIIDLTEKRNSATGCVMLLGGFDGLHLGHRKLVERAKGYGLPVGAMTIVGGKSEEGLFTPEEREEIFRKAGVDFVFELPFAEICDLSPERFTELLLFRFHPKAFVCGDDFRFGKGAEGTPETLKHGGQVRVEVVELLKADGEKISATTVKRLLEKGEVEKANALLGEEFFLVGEVEADRKVGRTIGFPTANIAYPAHKFPLKKGVYETLTETEFGTYKGITNYGSRPTFDSDKVVTETYLDGFSGDLYGKRCKVRFIRFLREVKKFESADGLKTQLQEDIRRVCEHDQIRTER